MGDAIYMDRITRFAASYGATVDWSEDRGEIVAIAPDGFVWDCNRARCIREWFSNAAGQRWVRQAVRDAKYLIGYGLRPATWPISL